MAERDDDCRARRANLAWGWVRMLIEAQEVIENRKEERQENVPVGRVEVTPKNWVGAQRNIVTTCSRGRESQLE